MEKHRAPLYEKLTEHDRSGSVSFHVPGHKFGRGPQFDSSTPAYYANMMALDGTEIAGFDDLHHPEGVIHEAQRLAATCFGAEETFFLVGGSSVGNMAMIASVCDRGDVLIVQRNVHKSVLHGLMIAGAEAVFLSPQVDRASGIATGVRVEDVTAALSQYPEAKGVLLTNPNYYGMGVDLEPIAAIVHDFGKPLLIDEAHGAHYGFHPDMPPSALSCGADAVVQSTHKMLSAMTMSAMLHVQGDRIDRQTLKQRLSMLQSSSPSYPLMASLDLARWEMDNKAKELLDQGLQVVRYFTGSMQDLEVYGVHIKKIDSAYDTLDPFKITVYDRTGTLSGIQLANEMERRGCFPEMADHKHMLLLFSLHSTRVDADRALEALQEISDEYRLKKQETSLSISNNKQSPPFMPLSSPIPFNLPPVRQSLQSDANSVRLKPLDEAIGSRSAEMVVPYPPGIPILYPGERITMETVQAIRQLIQAGVKFQGSDIGIEGKIHILTGGA